MRAHVWDGGHRRAVVQDLLGRPPVTALLQALPVQFVLLLQQRVQHTLHLRAALVRARLLYPLGHRAGLSPEIKSPLLEEFRAWGDLTAPVMLCPVADIRRTFATSTEPQVALEGFQGGLQVGNPSTHQNPAPTARPLQRKAEPPACIACRTSLPTPGDAPDLSVMGDQGDQPSSQPKRSQLRDPKSF